MNNLKNKITLQREYFKKKESILSDQKILTLGLNQTNLEEILDLLAWSNLYYLKLKDAKNSK